MDKADVMFSEKIELHFKQVERSTDLAVATIDVRFNSLKEYTDLRFRENLVSVEKAATELARRLNTLNHAHEQQVEDKRNLLSIIVYDAEHKEVTRQIIELRGFKSNMEGRFWALGIVITLLSIVIGVALRFIH
jgi:uncharacterized FlaG/YvyC family protein